MGSVAVSLLQAYLHIGLCQEVRNMPHEDCTELPGRALLEAALHSLCPWPLPQACGLQALWQLRQAWRVALIASFMPLMHVA